VMGTVENTLLRFFIEGESQTAEISFHRLLGESFLLVGGESRIPVAPTADNKCRRLLIMGDEQLPGEEADDDKLLRRRCINGFFKVGGES
jgi:hypothetical protein